MLRSLVGSEMCIRDSSVTMRLFTTSPCHVSKIGNKTANINAKKHSLSHQLTAKLHIENSKNKKMVIKFLQLSTFRRYAAIVLSPFFYFLLFSMCNCAVNWCDKLCFFCIYRPKGIHSYRRGAAQYECSASRVVQYVIT